ALNPLDARVHLFGQLGHGRPFGRLVLRAGHGKGVDACHSFNIRQEKKLHAPSPPLGSSTSPPKAGTLGKARVLTAAHRGILLLGLRRGGHTMSWAISLGRVA